jgi:hypothetical protein
MGIIPTATNLNNLPEEERSNQSGSNQEEYSICPCDNFSPYNENLDDHIRIYHRNEKGPGYVCPIVECGSVRDIINFKRHMPFHTKEKPFKCHECNHFFSTKDGLEKHKKRCVKKKLFTRYFS